MLKTKNDHAVKYKNSRVRICEHSKTEYYAICVGRTQTRKNSSETEGGQKFRRSLCLGTRNKQFSRRNMTSFGKKNGKNLVDVEYP